MRLADIARRSGVSPTTVSLVLRDKAGIPQETRTRVLRAARALGYRPNRAGKTQSPVRPPHPTPHRPGTLHTVGLLIKSTSDQSGAANPFYSHVLAGIEEECRSRRVNLLYATLPVDENNLPVEMPRLLGEKNVDGLLLVGTFLDKTLQHVLEAQSVPVVLVDGYSDYSYDSIVTDNVNGAAEAVTHLIRRGHRHIGIVGSRANAYPSIRERREGYVRALRENGISEKYFADSALDDAEATQAAHKLLSEHAEITALFGANDAIAIAAMHAAEALGFEVPHNLSVVGFDDIDVAQHVFPSLTTMHVDKIGMGRMAVQLLRNRAQHPEAERVTAVVRPRLIERQSVKTLTPEYAQ